jgi:hypothetical protein
MVNIAEKEKENKARLVVAWREAYRTDSHDTSTENNKVNRTINKKRAKIQSGYCMRVLGMKREEQKQCKQGLAGEKEGGAIMAVALERRDRCDGHPKIIIMPTRSGRHDDDFGPSRKQAKSTGATRDGAISGPSVPKTDIKDTCHKRKCTLFVLHKQGDSTHIVNQGVLQ